MISPRAEQIRKMLQRTPGDAFLLYGLALEHKKAGELDESLDLLGKTTAADPNFAYAYFQRGQIFETLSRTEDAKSAYRSGVEAATRAGDAHGVSEIGGALEALD